MSDNADDANWNCVVPFLDTDPKYAYGVEFGMLRMELKERDEVSGYYCRANQDQILLLLSRLGWNVVKMEIHDADWFWLEANTGAALADGWND